MRPWQRVAAPVVVALAALSIVVAGSAQTTQEFKAHFQDFDVCAPGIDECGHGHIQGFGTVTSASHARRPTTSGEAKTDLAGIA